MTPTTGTLIKHKSSDGLVEVWEHIPLGKTYRFDLDSITKETLYNTEFKKKHVKEIIRCLDNNEWFPTELLRIES